MCRGHVEVVERDHGDLRRHSVAEAALLGNRVVEYAQRAVYLLRLRRSVHSDVKAIELLLNAETSLWYACSLGTACSLRLQRELKQKSLLPVFLPSFSPDWATAFSTGASSLALRFRFTSAATWSLLSARRA